MKTIIINIMTIFIFSSLGLCQSSLVYDAGTIIDIGTGADVCADLVIINGTKTGTGSICDIPLPVELASFTSSVDINNVNLQWSSNSELNNYGFEVQRSIVNGEWSMLGFVNGNGNTSTLTNYSYTDRGINSGKYNYRLKQIDFNGNFQYYDLQNEVVIGIPDKFTLHQNYPNPFNPVTKINYDIVKDGIVTLKIYNSAGKEMKQIVNEFKTAGYYTVEFDGSELASGTYFYKLETGNDVSTKRMILIK